LLKGLKPCRPDDEIIDRCERLAVALETRRRFHVGLPHAFGFIGTRLALIALEPLSGDYIFAWETPGVVRRDYSLERDGPYLKVANAERLQSPDVRKVAEEVAREVFNFGVLEGAQSF
jgi:hypothetical protein